MAEGQFLLFRNAMRQAFLGDYAVETAGKMKMALLSTGATFTLGSVCVTDSVLNSVHTKGSAGNANKELANFKVTASASGTVRFDCDDITFTASSGTNLCARWAAVYQSGVQQPLFAAVLSTAEVVASQIIVQIAAGGLFEISVSDQSVA